MIQIAMKIRGNPEALVIVGVPLIFDPIRVSQRGL
jgi:hypothetical protein